MTLVEMLTVIAIIGVVAAISFPVFSGAKKSAYERQTVSDLKQISLAAMIYRENWKKTDYGDMVSMGLPEDYTAMLGTRTIRPPLSDADYPYYYYRPLPKEIERLPETWEQGSMRYGDQTMLVCDQWLEGRDAQSGWLRATVPSLPNQVWGVNLGGQLMRKRPYGNLFDFSRWSDPR